MKKGFLAPIFVMPFRAILGTQMASQKAPTGTYIYILLYI